MPTALTAPSQVAAGEQVLLGWTLANQGPLAASPPWVDTLYLSADAVVGPGDRILGSFSHGQPLAAGASGDMSQNVVVPNVAAGTYRFIVRTDSGRAVPELDEANNDRATTAPVTVTTPDLVPTDFTAPSTVAAGEQIAVTWTVRNEGSGRAAPSWSDAIYLSTDQVIGTGDHLVASFQHGEVLAAGDSYTMSQNVTVPNLPAGTYYLLLRSDNAKAVYEADDGNNDRTSGMAVTLTTPDLVPMAFSAPSTVVTAEQILVTWSVKNEGTGPAAGPWSDAIYLSIDPIIGSGDRLLGVFSHPGDLDVGAGYARSENVIIPNVVAGTYYLLLRADNGKAVYEADEGNNDTSGMAVALTTPDLVPTAFAAPSTVVTGQQIGALWTVANQGTGGTVPSWSDTIYLSSDPVVGVGDRTLGSFARPVALDADQSYERAQNVIVPNVVAGSYYLLLRVDSSNTLYEAHEDNNERSTGMVVTVTTPDLVASAVDAPAVVTRGARITVSWTVENQGTGPANGSWFDGLFLSLDGFVGPGDPSLGGFTRPLPLAPDAGYDESQSVTVPATIDPGMYFLIVRADSGSSVYEADDTNNVRAVMVEVQ